MGNQVTLTLAGDSAKLEKAFSDTTTSATQMQASVGATSSRMGSALDRVNNSAVFLTEGISGLGDAVGTFTSLSRDAAVRADVLARAHNDVSQAAQDFTQAIQDGREAILDFNQAGRDMAQSGIDVEQALLDQEVAQRELNAAIKEFGVGSIEARQAQLDLKQAGEDVAQAHQDADEAAIDVTQSLLDLGQSTIDAKDAQISLSEAQRNAVAPTELTVWTERLSALAPVLFAVIGVVQIFTATTWALNFAWLASPITWIILGIVALIAVIVLIATKTTWFQDAWNASWKWIKKTAMDVWDWLGTLPDKIGHTFRNLANMISWPFRTAFNLVSDAWNNTIGKLSWTMPSIFGVGGFTINAPQLPRFHAGGRVPGAPGEEMLAVLQAGERVTPAGSSGGSLGPDDLRMPSGSGMDRLFLSWLQELLRRNGLRLVVA